MLENTAQKNSEYGHFSCSVYIQRCIQNPVKHLRWSFLRCQLFSDSALNTLLQSVAKGFQVAFSFLYSLKISGFLIFLEVQKQPSRGVLGNRCSENMKEIYRRTPMPMCDFNRTAKKHY